MRRLHASANPAPCLTVSETLFQTCCSRDRCAPSVPDGFRALRSDVSSACDIPHSCLPSTAPLNQNEGSGSSRSNRCAFMPCISGVVIITVTALRVLFSQLHFTGWKLYSRCFCKCAKLCPVRQIAIFESHRQSWSEEPARARSARLVLNRVELLVCVVSCAGRQDSSLMSHECPGVVRYHRWNIFQLDLPMLWRVSYLLRQPSMHFYIQFVHNSGVVVGYIILCCSGAH